jgi:hypothetical protein
MDCYQICNCEHYKHNQCNDSHRPSEPETAQLTMFELMGVDFTHPIRSIKWLETIGIIAPPRDDPVALIPNAKDLRFLNQCERMVGMGPKIIPHEIPVRKPWQTSSRQKSSHSAVAAVAITRIRLERMFTDARNV